MNPCVFSFLMLLDFLKITFLYDNLVQVSRSFFFSSAVTSLMFQCFLKLYFVLRKTELFIFIHSNLFFAVFLSSIFILINDFSHVFWLNLMTFLLLFFFQNNSWFNVCFFPTGMDASQMHLLDVSYRVLETPQRGLICKSLRCLRGG